MASGPDSQFRYLNREGQWLDFHLHGVVLGSDGALRLPALPSLDSPDSVDLSGLAAPTRPAGIAAARDGQQFYSAPSTNEVRTIGGCLTESAAVQPPAGDLRPRLRHPAGLLLPSQRDVLMIADSGNDRIVLIDRLTFEVREIWGELEPLAASSRHSEPGYFHRPTGLAEASDGAIYVLDYGNQRVQKFDIYGQADARFATAVAAGGAAPTPIALAVADSGAGPRVYVLDGASNTITAYDSAGTRLKTPDGAWFAISASLEKPFAMCANREAIYVGDNSLRRILVFSAEDGRPIGEAAGYDGPVAALALDSTGRILALTGGGTAPLPIRSSGAWAAQGILWSSAISGGGTRVPWRQLRTQVDLPPGTHIQLFYVTRDDPAGIPVDVNAPNPLADPNWIAIPPGADDLFIPRPPSLYLFVGAMLVSDGTATPALHQIRVDFSADPLFERLPALYRNNAPRTDFLRRLTALFGSAFAEIEEEISGIGAVLDPLSVREQDLPWLASWLAVDLDPDAPLSERRRAIIDAFQNDGARGTAQGFKAALLIEAGVHATVTEPISEAAWWLLPAAPACGTPGPSAGPRLGEGTRLGAAEPFGAILSSTAAFGRSHLIADEEAGAPLFEPSAFRFTVEVHRAEVGTSARLQKVRDAIEREKPAHTVAQLEITEPTMRVGVQARLGIDTVVAGAPAPRALGSPPWRIGGDPEPETGSARLGQNLRIH